MSLGKVWNKASTKVMVYGGDWNSAQTSVRSSIFSKMIELARDRVKFYVGDLYHDALWLSEEVNGATTFEWVPRESGTHIGDTAKIVKDDDWADSARYRFEIREEDNQKWVLDTWELVVHEGTPIEDCDSAMTGAGCIYHPSPVGYVCTGVYSDYGTVQHDGDTCPIHEDPGAERRDAKYRDAMYESVQTQRDLQTGDWREEVPGTGKDYYGNPVDLGAKYRDAVLTPLPNVPDSVPFTPEFRETTDEQRDDIIKMLFEPNIPTLRNDFITEPSAPLRKGNKMDEIIRDLREKYEEASSSKDTLEEYQSNINDAVDELDTYMSDLDDLISSLDRLPEISVYVDLDTVSFDS